MTNMRPLHLLVIVFTFSSASLSDAAVISNIYDVCSYCTRPYNGNCNSGFAKGCIGAIFGYKKYVLGVDADVCNCYHEVAKMLIDICPGINTAVSYIGNCDTKCQYGPRCPSSPVAFSVMNSQNINLVGDPAGSRSDGSKPAKIGSAAAKILFYPNKKGSAKICVAFKARKLSGIKELSLNRGKMGFAGKKLLHLFNGFVPASGKTCVKTTNNVIKYIAGNPYSIYAQATTYGGESVRGQLVQSPHLFSVATGGRAGVNCPTSECNVVADFGISTFTLAYQLEYSSKYTEHVVSASIANDTSPASYPDVQFFGPGIAPVSKMNGVTPPPDTLLQLLAGPKYQILNITTREHASGALRGTLTDLFKIKAQLYSSNVVGARVAVQGSAKFSATVGGGAICYYLSLENAGLAKPVTGFIFQGESGHSGPRVLSTRLVANGKYSCAEIDPVVTAAIVMNPKSYYIQIGAVVSSSGRQQMGYLRSQLDWDTSGF